MNIELLTEHLSSYLYRHEPSISVCINLKRQFDNILSDYVKNHFGDDFNEHLKSNEVNNDDA